MRMSLADKGPAAKPPLLKGAAQDVVAALVRWPAIIVNAHWNEYAPGGPDGVDFYVDRDGDERGAARNELGHVHLDGEVHLATPPSLGKALIKAGLAERFPYGGAGSWVVYRVRTKKQVAHALWLFGLAYDVLRGRSAADAIATIAVKVGSAKARLASP